MSRKIASKNLGNKTSLSNDDFDIVDERSHSCTPRRTQVSQQNVSWHEYTSSNQNRESKTSNRSTKEIYNSTSNNNSKTSRVPYRNPNGVYGGHDRNKSGSHDTQERASEETSKASRKKTDSESNPKGRSQTSMSSRSSESHLSPKLPINKQQGRSRATEETSKASRKETDSESNPKGRSQTSMSSRSSESHLSPRLPINNQQERSRSKMPSLTPAKVSSPTQTSVGKVHTPNETLLTQNNRSENDTLSKSKNLLQIPTVKVYKDNPENRRKNRVGKPIGTAVYHKASGIMTQEKYKDNSLNRKLNRVGLPRGSRPINKETEITKIINNKLNNAEIDSNSLDGNDSLEGTDTRYLSDQLPSINNSAKLQETCFKNRQLEEQTWQNTQKENPRTNTEVLRFSGKEIPFKEITIGKKIGEGGFGEVYFSSWRGSVVAVKMMRVDKVSKRKAEEFRAEITKYCQLENDNIVKFIGACLEQANLCIVMEYMDMSLFEALRIQEIDFEEHQKINIAKQLTRGLKYLHSKNYAHCDLKPQNVLLNIHEEEICKITDFGLSMVREESQSSVEATAVKHAGTPRYSAPEVLRGELLAASDMMRTDIYSLSLVLLEIIYDEEPFYNLSYAQLQKQIGDCGMIPDVSDEVEVKSEILNMIKRGCAFESKRRPDINELAAFWENVRKIYYRE